MLDVNIKREQLKKQYEDAVQMKNWLAEEMNKNLTDIFRIEAQLQLLDELSKEV
jgi:hypothetical protein